jgi:hypothetical protein
MRSSHSLDRVETVFDGTQLVADAGLLLPATLAQHLGLRELVNRHLDLGEKPGAAHVGDKLLTLVMSALAGGDCIDDAGALRAGGTERILGFTLKAASTWAPFCGAFAGATFASSTGSAESSSPAPGRPALDPDPSRSRSISTRRSARRTASRSRAPCITGTPRCAAITRSWRWRPGPATF